MLSIPTYPTPQHEGPRLVVGFGKRIVFPSTPSAWGRYTIRFSELTQDPWGHQAAAFDPATLYAVRFLITPGSRFDLWIDDVTFVR